MLTFRHEKVCKYIYTDKTSYLPRYRDASSWLFNLGISRNRLHLRPLSIEEEYYSNFFSISHLASEPGRLVRHLKHSFNLGKLFSRHDGQIQSPGRTLNLSSSPVRTSFIEAIGSFLELGLISAVGWLVAQLKHSVRFAKLWFVQDGQIQSPDFASGLLPPTAVGRLVVHL